MSDFDTKVPCSTVVATQSKDSLTLSLVDAKETITHDSFPEEIVLDAKVEDGNIDEENISKKSPATITICG